MNRNHYLIIAAFAAVTLIMFSGYAVAGSNHIPITIHNTQTTNTLIGFQQMVTFNAMNSIYTPYEANDLGNIRFSVGAMTANSWCENCGNTINSIRPSNAIFWVKLPIGVNGIQYPTGNSITLNMTFLANTIHYNGTTAGECPTCSVTGYLTNTITNNYPITNTTASAFDPAGYSATATPSDGSASLYLCGGALNSFLYDGLYNDNLWSSWNQDTNDYDAQITSIGNQNYDGCQAGSNNPPDPMVVSGISINGFTSYNLFTGSSHGPSTQTDLNNNGGFTVSTNNAFVVIIVECGDSACDNSLPAQATNSTGYVTLPTGCTNQTIEDGDGYETSLIATCDLAPGSYDVYANNNGNNGGAEMALAAYVFQNESSTTTTTDLGYAQYDNGANIFNYYNNGNTILGLTTNQVGSLASISYNGPYGTTQKVLAVGGQGAGPQNNQEAVITNALMGNLIIEGWINIDGNNNGFFGVRAPNLRGDNCYSYLMGDGWNSYGVSVQLQNPSHCGGTLGLFPVGSIKYGWYWEYGSANGNYLNSTMYTSPEGSIIYSTNGHDGTIGSNNLYASLAAYDGLSAPAYFADVRVRQFPPNNIMPSVSFGPFTPYNQSLSVCPSGPFAIVSGGSYVNQDPTNTMFLASAYVGPGTTNGFVNGTIQFTMTTNGAVGAQVVGYGWNFSDTFTTAPNVIIQCFTYQNPSGFFVAGEIFQQKNIYIYIAVGITCGLILGIILMKKGELRGRRTKPKPNQ